MSVHQNVKRTRWRSALLALPLLAVLSWQGVDARTVLANEKTIGHWRSGILIETGTSTPQTYRAAVSMSRADVLFVVDLQRNCRTVDMTLIMGARPRSGQANPLEGGLWRARVDERRIREGAWLYSSGRTDRGATFAQLVTPSANRLLREIREGEVLRMQLSFDNGHPNVDLRFALAGAAKSLTRIADLCRHFEDVTPTHPKPPRWHAPRRAPQKPHGHQAI